jgi:hypothetical protein
MTQTKFSANNSYPSILLKSSHFITFLTVLHSYSTGFQIASFYLFHVISLTILYYYVITKNMTANFILISPFTINSHLDIYNQELKAYKKNLTITESSPA